MLGMMMRTPELDVHIHMFSRGAEELSRYLIFRNRLRTNETDRKAYESVKRGLAKHCWNDMNDYADAKTQIVERILASSS